MIKYQITQKMLAEKAQKVFQERINQVKSGKVIRRRYATSTIKRRRKFGLYTASVNLTGSQAYDNKNWRLLDSWVIRPKGTDTVVATWTRQDASRIYEYHVRRFGQFLKKRG